MDLGQIFTSKKIADYMISKFNLDSSAKILDPCFGSGVFLNACREKGYTSVAGCEIDKELYVKVKKKYPEYVLYCRDFLSFEPKEKYDGIVMNPPYIRHEKIDDLCSLGITKKSLRKNPLYNKLPSTANLYMFFLIKALDLLKDGGQLVVIFPSSWMQAKNGLKFEELLFANSVLTDEIHVSGDIFERNALVDVIILKLKKGKQIINRNKTVFMELVNDNLVEKGHHDNWLTLPLYVPFKSYSAIRRGLTTGWNKMFINPDISEKKNTKFIKKILSTPKSIIGYNTFSAKTDCLLMINEGDIFGDEISSYIRSFELELEKDKKPKVLFEKKKSSSEWFALKPIDCAGIIFSYFVRNDMKFVMNTANILVRDNFYVIYPKIDKYLMFALLNNFYTYYQLETIGKKYGAGLLKLQRYDIENLKFIDITKLSDDDRQELISLAKDLVNNSNKENINDITKIIEKYLEVSADYIKDAYENVKRKRLEVS